MNNCNELYNWYMNDISYDEFINMFKQKSIISKKSSTLCYELCIPQTLNEIIIED